MEKLNPAKKRSLAESSVGQKEVIQIWSLDEEEEDLTSRKKRKFASAKVKSQPVRWSSRKATTVKKEELKLEAKTFVTPKLRTKTPATAKSVGRSKEVLDELNISEEFLVENKLEEVFELLKFQGWVTKQYKTAPEDKTGPEEGESSKDAEESDLIKIKKSLERLEKNFDNQRIEIAELKG